MRDKSEYETQEYWDKLLKDYGLTMGKGLSTRVSYVEDSNILARIEGEQSTKTGRVKPKATDN